jgi:hypothetical protein
MHRCPLCHGACKEPASPAPSLPRHVLDARRRAYSRATPQCLRPPLLLLPRRRCATAQASDKAARQLAACRWLPHHILHHAVTLRVTALSLLLSLSRHRRLLVLYSPGHLLSAAYAISFAHGSIGYGVKVMPGSLRSTVPSRSGVNRYAIEHNSALKQTRPVAPLKLCLVVWRFAPFGFV